MQVLQHGKVVGTSQKWPAKAGGRSPKGPAVAGTTVAVFVFYCLVYLVPTFTSEINDY